jgi:hypothetical protein
MSRQTLGKNTLRLIHAADTAIATSRQLCAERKHMMARLNRDAFVRLFGHDAPAMDAEQETRKRRTAG